MCDMSGKACFSKKVFTNRLNMGLPQLAWIKRIVDGLETQWLSGKENILGTMVNKEGYADNPLRNKKNIHHYWFPWKRCNCKILPVANSLGKIPFIYWMTFILVIWYSYLVIRLDCMTNEYISYFILYLNL